MQWVKESGIATAAVWIQSLAQELPHNPGAAKKKKKKKDTYVLFIKQYIQE